MIWGVERKKLGVNRISLNKRVVFGFICFSPITRLTPNRLTQPNTFDTPNPKQGRNDIRTYMGIFERKRKTIKKSHKRHKWSTADNLRVRLDFFFLLLIF